MLSDTPRLPKGPKPHKFEPDTYREVGYPIRCVAEGCGLPENDPIHVSADADPPPGDPDTGN
jgi:hypothetical protein